MTGAKKYVESEGIADKPRVRHGATIEGIVNRTTVDTKQSRLTAGFPVAFWPIVMAVFVFNLACYSCAGTPYEKVVRGALG